LDTSARARARAAGRRRPPPARRRGVVDVYTAILAVAAFVVLYRFHGKLTVLYVVLGCGAIGALLQATVI
jgi:hypothetical protein